MIWAGVSVLGARPHCCPVAVFSLLVLLPAIGGVLSALLVFTLGNGSILASNLLATNGVSHLCVERTYTHARAHLHTYTPNMFLWQHLIQGADSGWFGGSMREIWVTKMYFLKRAVQ